MSPPHRPLVIAHAGGAGHAPENTLAAIGKALALGADAIEVDVQATADQVPVLIHDPTVDRTTDGSGPVASLTLAQIKALDAGAKAFGGAFPGEPVPTLAEALALTRGHALLIAEIKRPGIEPQVAQVVAENDALAQVMVWSFFPQALEAMRSIEPRLPCLLLSPGTGALWPQMRELALRLGLQGISLHYQSLSPALVADARQAGLTLFTWTVDPQEEIQKVIAFGVDGIVSNYPERVRALLPA